MGKMHKVYDKNYTVLDNTILRDNRLSLQAWGLFTYCWSMPDDWVFYEDELLKHFTNGKGSMQTARDELEKFGYLKRKRNRNSKGQFTDPDWLLIPEPTSNFPMLDKPKQEKPALENQQLQNTNPTKYSSNKVRTKDIGQVEPDDIPYKEIIDYLNKKTNRPKNKYFKASSKTNRKLIHARWKEGYRLKDFKEVINNKCFSWMNNPEMFDYLRPSTLFGPKFDQYLKEMHIPSNATPYDLKDFENQKLPQDDDLPF
ncbi:MAG: conserved phage C-terminal domain-containing protein [Lactobacillus johnsonii]|nr:conserved phage C-terminal domain-containing protein [Lactobacillus johnsonii]MCI7590937.1 conserved phage C-terminal domain-containing protein [Lactobacillus johnsonii]MCI7647861.1 conserved phage C-terminal domain-containing protein [Lactobacillus johnsonii]MDY5419436.1 conserved phage C-terminal domain-containing protein [Lactobacillus johnsonii]